LNENNLFRNTGETHFVIGVLEGESYLHEALANLLYYKAFAYGKEVRIDSNRISVFCSMEGIRSLKRFLLGVEQVMSSLGMYL
jgi:hypothetical protein